MSMSFIDETIFKLCIVIIFGRWFYIHPYDNDKCLACTMHLLNEEYSLNIYMF